MLRHATAAATGLLFVCACAGAPQPSGQPSTHVFGACEDGVPGSYGVGTVQAVHVTMRDGVRIALDVLLPSGLTEGQRVPTMLTMTRYWRGWEDGEITPVQHFYLSHGYAVVWGDVRGTGASFGNWPHHRARDETLDYGEVIEWIIRQPWSDGNVGAWGTSYTANTADWMVERNHPALKAVVSRFPDYDPYADLYFPGGVPNAYMGRTWGLRVKRMDLNEPTSRGGAVRRVRPVDGPDGVALLEAAIASRRDVPDVWQGLQQVTFKDDRPPEWGGWSMDDWGIHAWRDAVERSNTAIYSWGSWLDAGTANGVLRRFMTLRYRKRVVVGPWSHGANHHVSPYLPVDAPTDPAVDVQRVEELCFLDQYVRGRDTGMRDRLLVYYTMGEERWKTTTEWPIPGTRMTSWYFAADGRLDTSAPTGPGADEYIVDFSATTGTGNRWATNNTSGDVVYPDRAEADRRLLTYTSDALESDIEVTGQPVVTLWVTSTHDDGAFFVYLEDVAPDGTVHYVTEGMLRAVHRRISDTAPPYRVLGPYHTYRREDALPLVPGEIAEISFELLPTSVLFRAGHRIRVAVAGADADTFRRIPESGDPVITLARDRVHASHISLPVIPR
jgi:putative CocE/NonD family hydrolase